MNAPIVLVVIAFTLVTLALSVWRSNRYHPLNRYFAVLTFSTGCWTLGIGGVNLSAHTDFWLRFAFAGASLIAPALLSFARWWPAPTVWPNKMVVRAIWITGVILSLLSLASPLIIFN